MNLLSDAAQSQTWPELKPLIVRLPAPSARRGEC